MLILIPSWISNYIHDKVVNIITYPCPTFNHSIFEVWEWIINLISQFIVHEITYVWRDWNETILVKKRPLASDMCMTTISYILKIHLACMQTEMQVPQQQDCIVSYHIMIGESIVRKLHSLLCIREIAWEKCMICAVWLFPFRSLTPSTRFVREIWTVKMKKLKRP